MILQHHAKVGKINRVLSVPLDRPIDQVDGHVAASDLVGNETKQVQGVRVVRLGRQHAPIAGLGFGQLSGLLVFETCLQEVGAGGRNP